MLSCFIDYITDLRVGKEIYEQIFERTREIEEEKRNTP